MTSDLVQTWRMADEVNHFLLAALKPSWLDARYAPRTRTVRAQFAHIHNVRLRWLRHAAPAFVGGAQPIAKDEEPTLAQLRKALTASATSIAAYLGDCAEKGAVRGWNGPPASLLGYLIAHEAHHRGLAMVALRSAGHRLAPETVYGQWDWGKRQTRRKP